MANHKSALKRIRSSARRRARNRVYKSLTRTEVKKARLLVESGSDLKAAADQVRAAASQLDKAVSKGVIHKNAAARRKSRLMKRLAKLQQAS
ncbi:MAG: 30S ribosomal protein S20 [Anaerolineae bacterium]|nr:MAG: 30S ribosomal protein S20 [Anaerolineae bacterium]MCL4877728.1 30S ribosomal protein S20 [Anaerolineae bacterium]